MRGGYCPELSFYEYILTHLKWVLVTFRRFHRMYVIDASIDASHPASLRNISHCWRRACALIIRVLTSCMENRDELSIEFLYNVYQISETIWLFWYVYTNDDFYVDYRHELGRDFDFSNTDLAIPIIKIEIVARSKCATLDATASPLPRRLNEPRITNFPGRPVFDDGKKHDWVELVL